MISAAAIRAAIPSVLTEAAFAELPNYYRGKVRENYDLPDFCKGIENGYASN